MRLRRGVARLPPVEALAGSPSGESQTDATARQRTANAVLLPIALLADIGLGLALLDRLAAPGHSGWFQVVAGALLCLIAGWIASGIWSRSYWNRSTARQVETWRRITDAFFTWVEDLQLSTEALNQLKVSLEEAVPTESA